VTTAGADNNQQNAAAGAVKMADVAAAGAEIALAATAAAAAAAEAVALSVAETAATAAIAMTMAKGKTRGSGRDWGYVRVPRIQLGNYLAPSKAMFLANAYLEGSHFFADRQSFICTADRFICLRR
jgi:hypothetical protein